MYNLRGVDRGFVAAEPGAAAPTGTASTFGVQLFEALFQGETREVLSRTESEAKRRADTGVRIRLSMNLAAEGMAEVASLPWELMRRRDQSPLVVSVQTPVVRAFDTPKPIYLQPVEGKLRILALVSNPKGTAALNLADEVARISKIWATLDNVEVDFVRPVEAEILNKLAEHQYHVIHYMGHGDFDSGAGGLLMMERDDGSAQLVSGDTFAAWMQDEPLRLVFLNACNTGTTGEHMGLHPFAGVASALIRSGVPAVVAMQFPISDKAAILFAQTFYERIAQNFPVDAAASDGRKRLLTSEGAEWATPVLYMRAADGNLFEQAKPELTPRKRVAAKVAAKAAGVLAEPEPSATPDLPPLVERPVAAPQPFLGAAQELMDAASPPRPWYKKPMVLAGVAAALLVGIGIVAASNDDATVTSTSSVESNDPAAAAIAAIPGGTWIYDADEEATASAVLAKAPLPQLQALADAGNAKAAYLVGNTLWYGVGGTPVSQATAAAYYAKAADQGLVVGKYALGYALAAGVKAETDAAGGTIAGIPIDDAKAKPLLREAAAQGNAAAWQVLIDSYAEILVIPDNSVPDPNNPATDAIAAIEPLRWNDDQNVYVNPPANVAQSVLAKTSIDNVRALAKAGNAKANYVMGRVYQEGLAGNAQNIAKATSYMKVAARAGIAEALYFMGVATTQGVPALDVANPKIEPDANLARAFFKKAGELGNPHGAAAAAG
jgi:TPR repeat protein